MERDRVDARLDPGAPLDELPTQLKSALELPHLADHEGPAEVCGGRTGALIGRLRGGDGAPAGGMRIGAIIAAFGIDQRSVVTTLQQLGQTVREIELGVEAIALIDGQINRMQRVDDSGLDLATANLQLRTIVGQIRILLRSSLLADRVDGALQRDRRSPMVKRAIFLGARNTDPGPERDVAQPERSGRLGRPGIGRDRGLIIAAHPLCCCKLEQRSRPHLASAVVNKFTEAARQGIQQRAVLLPRNAKSVQERIALRTVALRHIDGLSH